MTLRMQEFGFRQSRYERPTQDWICGRTDEGESCLVGPDVRGRCRVTFECEPLRQDDRWRCSRVDQRGGPCEDGPRPDGTCCRPIPRCQPVRSLRAQRGAVVRWVSAVTVGIALLLFVGPADPGLVSPGELSFKHGEIERCDTCHTSLGDGSSGWITAALGSATPGADSRQCLACHRLGSDGLAPHSQAPIRLAALREGAATSSDGAPLIMRISTLTLSPPGANGEPLSCASCHSEHRGQGARLTVMDSQRCQACHLSQFASLADGHPAFSDYPFARRTRLVFDHVSHLGKHFAGRDKELAPTQCTACHKADPTGRAMLVRSFETSCAACHAKQIEGEGGIGVSGVALFAVPGLDVTALRDQAVEIGEWPALAESGLGPFMRLLLSHDTAVVASLATLDSVDLLDLTEASQGELAAVERLSWAVKELLFELERGGQSALRARLEAVLGRELDARELADLAARLPADLLRVVREIWFPNLALEIARHRAGEAVAIPAMLTRDAEAGQKTVIKQARDDTDDDILDDEDEQILADADDGDILDDEDEQILADADDGDILEDDEDGDILEDESASEDESGETVGAGDRHVVVVEDEAMPTQARMAGGGWYREDYALRYRPAGHADGFLRAWLEVSGRVQGAPGAAAARALFAKLSARSTPGLCTKCHSIDGAADGTLAVNWRGGRVDPLQHDFTRFAHTPHFSLLDDRGCQTCHRLDIRADYASSFEDNRSDTFVSNFGIAPREVCAECHVESQAGDSCTTCHNYHVGRMLPVLPQGMHVVTSGAGR